MRIFLEMGGGGVGGVGGAEKGDIKKPRVFYDFFLIYFVFLNDFFMAPLYPQKKYCTQTNGHEKIIHLS